MGTTSDKLTYLNDTKTQIRDGINALGGSLDSDDTFRSYVDELDNLWEELPHTTGTGTSLSLATKSGKMKVNLLGNTSQTGTPTPSSPIPVNVVSGDNEVVVKNKNLYQNSNPIPKAANGNVSTTTTEYIDSNSFKINLKKTTTDNNSMFCQIPLDVNDFKPSTTYTLSKTNTIVGTQFNGAGALRTYINGNYGTTTYSDSITFTTPSTLSSFAVLFYGCHSSTQQGEATITINEIQLEENNTQTAFEPYTSTSYPIHLGDKELCKIGTYQDKFIRNSGKNLVNKLTKNGNTIYIGEITTPTFIFEAGTYTISYESSKTIGTYIQKESDATSTNLGNDKTITFTSNEKFSIWFWQSGLQIEDIIHPMLNEGSIALPYEPYGNGDWYLEKKIEKVVLNGSEVWTKHGSIASWFYYDNIKDGYLDNTQSNFALCNCFVQNSYNNVTSLIHGQFAYGTSDGGITHRLVMKDTDFTETQDFMTWLSTNNITLYYTLAAPYLSLVEDTTLISQLDAIEKAQSYKGQTNISQLNNDLPFELNVTALEAWS